jgi:hypothetical protein
MPDEIVTAFEAGKRRGASASVFDAPPAHERAKQMVREAREPQDYLAAAEQLGFAYQIAENCGFTGDQFDILDVMGSIYTRFPSIDTDVASIEASKWMRRAGRGFVQMGEMRSAAIPYTNAAVALMEKSSISESEFKRIKQLIDFGFNHKQPDTVDWGYSEAALGMYYARLKFTSKSDRIANLEASKEAHDRAMEIFEARGEVVSVASRSMISRVERNLYRERLNQKIADALIDHIADLPVAAQRWAPEIPNMIADSIRRNPASYGFDTVPNWLSELTDSPPSDEDADMLRAARDRLVSAVENDVGSDYTALLDCRWQAAEIDVDLLPAGEAYQNMLDLITAYASDFTPEQFIRRGSYVTGMARYVGEQPPVDFLLAIADAFGRISGQRDAKRLEVFLRENPAHMRFVACDLCEHGLWDSAISVIENSRVLLYSVHAQESRECDLPSTDPIDAPSWVYVIHSPKGTYVIIGPKDEQGSASGVFVEGIDGAKLSELHFSFADESVGLMHAQVGGMPSHLSAATAKAFEILAPLSQAIRDLVPDDQGICLIIGGLYVTLPVAAALSVDGSVHYPFVAVVPSRTHTVARRYSLPLNENFVATAMSVSDASWIPDMPILTYPRDEAIALERLLSATDAQVSVIDQACAADFETAFKSSNLVHFSGHSVATPFEPEYASMLYADGPYAVTFILNHPPVRNLLLATISSCQSGHQSTTVLADELLGINTALLYRGCRITLSTLWPIFDVVSYVVTSRFYSELARESDVHIETLYRALTKTQTWVRTSTTGEISDFLEANGLKVPTLLESSSAESVLFGHPRVWAAYYLSSRCL